MYHTNIWSFVSDDEKYIHYVMNGDMTSEPRVSYVLNYFHMRKLPSGHKIKRVRGPFSILTIPNLCIYLFLLYINYLSTQK